MIGFDLNKYANCAFALNYIAMLCNKYSSRIILSSGLTCKTQLTVYGGDGYLFNTFSQRSEIYKHFDHVIENDGILKEVTLMNKLRLLDWKIKKELVEVVVTWQCQKCGLSQSEKIEAFKKFGKRFCSMKCLKSYNF